MPPLFDVVAVVLVVLGVVTVGQWVALFCLSLTVNAALRLLSGWTRGREDE